MLPRLKHHLEIINYLISTIHTHLSKNIQTRLFILNFLTIIIFIHSFFEYSILDNNHAKRMNVSILAASVAISELKHGGSGYMGYVKVLRNMPAGNEQLRSTTAFEKALSLSDVASDGLHFMMVDVGFASHYKWAFRLFGYQLRSLEYLCFSLIAISAITFWFMFKNDELSMFLLFIFSCSFLLIVEATNIVGVELQIYDYRFYPVITILPALHIGLLVLKKQPPRISGIVSASIQTFILIFIIHGSTRSKYQMFFLFTVPLIIFIENLKKTGLRAILANIKIWPLFIVLAGYIILNIHLSIALSPRYEKIAITRQPWCISINALTINPDFQKKYNFPFFREPDCFAIVKRRAQKDGLVFDLNQNGGLAGDTLRHNFDVPFDKEIRYNSPEYENYLKEEFLEIVRESPWLAIESYLLKFREFFKVYFSNSNLIIGARLDSLGAGKLLLNPVILLILTISLILFKNVIQENGIQYQRIVFWQFLCSLITPMVIVPMSCYLADSGLSFTLLIYLTASIIISKFLNRKPAPALTPKP